MSRRHSRTYKTVYGGEWVNVRNLMNKRFKAGSPCEICRTFKCAPVWYSIKTHKVRCMRCFDAVEYADRQGQCTDHIETHSDRGYYIDQHGMGRKE